MKQKDIILIIVVVFISGVASFFISNALFGSPAKNKTEVEVVEPIASEFIQPDTRYFNKDAIDPTQLIQLGGPGNPQPL
jgi:hypothetical protein